MPIIIIAVLIIAVVALVFIVRKLSLQKKKIEEIMQVEKMLETEKLPPGSETANFEKTLRELPDENKRALGLYLITETLFHKNKNESELKHLRDIYFELTEKYGNFKKIDEVLFKLANIYFFDYFNFIESIKYYEKLLKEYPNSKWIKVISERLTLIKSAYPNEEPALKKYALAEKHFEAQDFDKTIEHLQFIINTYPNTKLAGTAYYFLGDIFFFKKTNPTMALEYYSKLAEKMPAHRNTGSAQFKIAETYRKLRKPNEAIVAYKKFLENFNDFQYTDYAQYYIGQCYEELKDWTLALRTYKFLVANYPESIWIGIATSKIKNLENMVK